MERGPELFPGFNPDGELPAGEREPTPEKEKTEAELMLEVFENGARFDDEDEKARDYNARLDQADAMQEEVDEISKQIAQATSQLASVPLTHEQLALLDEIEKCMARRKVVNDTQERARLDAEIADKTKQLADLPVTPEQADLLDGILEMMDAREATAVKLRTVFGQEI